MTANFWSEDEKRKAIALAEQGLTRAQIGERVGRSGKSVASMLLREIHKGRVTKEVRDRFFRPAQGEYWRDEHITEAATLFAQGMLVKSIAATLNRTEMAVKSLLRKMRMDGDPRFPRRDPPRKPRSDKYTSQTVIFDAPQACLAHWRDLDRHHPSGWASYRITGTDYRTASRPSGSHLSLVGSAAAMCENN